MDVMSLSLSLSLSLISLCPNMRLWLSVFESSQNEKKQEPTRERKLLRTKYSTQEEQHMHAVLTGSSSPNSSIYTRTLLPPNFCSHTHLASCHIPLVLLYMLLLLLFHPILLQTC
ncbi:hypothetical protein BKA57DRAFT_473397 [Linnemannia elongata]|nr:hypothetical protein BKA57DRAFT_473397 [Linnemannia elongata]